MKSDKKQNKITKTTKTKRGTDYSPYIISLKDIFKNAPDNLNNKPDFSPLSGSEPNFEPSKWNDRSNIKYTHNCYAYVLNRILQQRIGKPQPGYFSNFPPLSINDYHCQEFYKRLKKDMPSMYLVKFDERCKKGFYKGFIVLDDKASDQDYHFYRQDSSGYWSHKPGRTEAIDFDASDQKIINPEKANRKYKSYNYSKPCFFFCLNPDLSKAHSVTKA